MDAEDAIEWYSAAAHAGHPYGEYNLGLALLAGNGIEADPRAAARWFKKAAHQGFRPAQFQLGKLYFDGHGVKRNDIKAYGWWSISIQDNNELTPELLSKLVDRMDPNYRDRAVQLAERHKQRYGMPDRTPK